MFTPVTTFFLLAGALPQRQPAAGGAQGCLGAEGVKDSPAWGQQHLPAGGFWEPEEPDQPGTREQQD